MKKKLLCLLGLAALTLGLGACGNKGGEGGDGGNTPVEPAKQTFTVIFEVDGARHATARVKDGEKVTDQIDTPVKTGYTFVGWYEGETLVDLSTYVVTHNVTLTAKFEEINIPEYNVEDTKVADKEYYLVVGWWECVDPEDPTKKTSHLTPELVRLFHYNLNRYLVATGATEDNLAAISFRNYSTATVAQMGNKVKADADVDLMIGVGNNVNSTAGLTLYESSNDYKFETKMGNPLTDRYVACLSYASELGVRVFDWLEDKDLSKESFNRILSDEEIETSKVPTPVDLTVTVHGDTDVVTHLTDKRTPIDMPEITVPADKNFKGFALTENGEVALEVAKDASLNYKKLIGFVAENAKTLDLWPILEDKPVVLDDLVVYIQVYGSNLYKSEAELLEARFNASLTEEKHVKFNIVEGDSSKFVFGEGGIGNDVDVIIGGNTPVKDFGKYQPETYPIVSCGAKHFQSTNRKVIISDKVAASHVALAAQFYTFVTTAAPEYTVHTTFWQKANKSWVSDAEKTAMLTGMETEMKAYMHVTGEDTLADKYNITFLNESVTTDTTAGKDKVADLAAATLALREGKGTDLIIGCGSNIDSQTGLTHVEKKGISNDAHTFVAADTRYVARVTNNPLAKDIFNTYFVLPTAA